MEKEVLMVGVSEVTILTEQQWYLQKAHPYLLSPSYLALQIHLKIYSNFE